MYKQQRVDTLKEAGTSVNVIATEPENVSYDSPDVCIELVEQLKLAGIKNIQIVG